MAKDAGEKIMENFRSDALPPPTPIETATMLTFCMGIWQLLCGIFRLQFIVSYFSDSLISGFTTGYKLRMFLITHFHLGAGCHVLVAQFDNLIGVTTHNSSSFFYIFERVLRIPSQIEHVNVYTCIISVLSIIFLEIGKDIISPWLAKKHNFKFPLPYDLILIIISAAASIILQFNLNYGIRVVGEIPEGMPSPILPNFSIFLPSLIHSIPLAVVTIAVHIAMAKMLAKDVGYQLDDHQEFYALGLTSMLSALFPLYPMSTGVGRTIASIKAGTNTQLSSLFCSGLLFLVILKIGSYLEQLPKCVLSAIIVTALLSLFKKKDELKRLYIVSKIDFIIWILSFVSTVCIGVIEGLAISICAGLLSIVLRTQWPRYGSFTYPTSHKSELTSSICVFRFDGPLLFTNCERFIKSFERIFSEWMRTLDLEKSERPVFFIMDCSSISHIDFMGIKALENIAKELKTSGVSLYLVGTNKIFRRKIDYCEIDQLLPTEFLFPTVKDAVMFAERNGEAADMLNLAAKRIFENRASYENEKFNEPLKMSKKNENQSQNDVRTTNNFINAIDKKNNC
ncbi:hypothetical protein WR25_06185 isoform D [Diploscapter pachys]|uniref:STAS domain-containing protein n=3 Tax=Diploscapter pachys TaxID=2018661 RepID=A0A2A2LSP3_9BILA|nr:hypothetical protein WR25_06185 isoform D [Diploscapter pachys]